MASAPAEESTASTDSACAAACSANPPVEVKQSSTRPRAQRRRRQVVFALIQIHAGLLAVQQIGFELQPVHPDVHSLRNFAGERDHFQRQALQLADAGVVARQNAGGLQQLLQAIDDDVARAIHALVRVCSTR